MDLLRAAAANVGSSSGYYRKDLLTPEEHEADKETLFRKTSDAVKAVQRRFHSKTEIATGGDSSVSLLCSQLESVFLHGLKPPKKRGADHAYWPAVERVLEPAAMLATGHILVAFHTDYTALLSYAPIVFDDVDGTEDAKFVMELRHITTESGKGRAWIRWALNERLLEQYLHKLQSNRGALLSHYDEYAFLADEDRVSMLAMLVVGLQSLLFGIEMDLADLNKVREFQQPASSSSAAPSSSGGGGGGDSGIGGTASLPAEPSFSQVPTPAAVVNFHEPMETITVTKKKKKKKKREKASSRSSVPDFSSASHEMTGTFERSMSVPTAVVNTDTTLGPVELSYPTTSSRTSSAASSESPPLLANNDHNGVFAPVPLSTSPSSALLSSLNGGNSAAIPTTTAGILENIDSLLEPGGGGGGGGGGSGVSGQSQSSAAMDVIASLTGGTSLPPSLGHSRTGSATTGGGLSALDSLRSDGVLSDALSAALGESSSSNPPSMMMTAPASGQPSLPSASISSGAFSSSLPPPPDATVALAAGGASAGGFSNGFGGSSSFESVPALQGGAAVEAAEDGMSAVELKRVLLGVMRAKETLEEEVAALKMQHAETTAEVAANQAGATVVESTLNETVLELQGKADDQERTMEALTKENGLLKQQLKKYVFEATLLKRQNKELTEKAEAAAVAASTGSAAVDGAAGVLGLGAGADDDALTEREEMELTIGQYDSIEDMQAHHERQILQLSEMHCDLMEMSERQQDQIRQRDQIIVTLGGEVPAGSAGPGSGGRGGGGGGGGSGKVSAPMGNRHASAGALARPARLAKPSQPGLTLPGSNRPVIDIWIPSALLRGKGSDTHHVFQVYVRCGDDEWNVYRRFTHFSDLHQQVTRIFGTNKIKLPRKKAFGKKSAKFVEERRKELENYIRQIIQLCLGQTRSPLVQNPCKQTLCEAIPFLREKLSSSSGVAGGGGSGGGGGGGSGGGGGGGYSGF